MEDLHKLLKVKFELPEVSYPGRINEVKIGATKSEGGTRKKTIIVGGENNLPFFSSKTIFPVLALQILDKPLNVPKQVLMEFGKTVENPIEWAEACVKKFEVELLAIKFISFHPSYGVSSKVEFKENLKKILNIIDVPLILCAPGSQEKDAEVLEEAAKIVKGEKCILASATLTNNYRKIAEAALKNEHLVVAETDCDPVLQKTLNERLISEGLPINQILMDPTSAALGLGIEYSISIIEQLKLNALKGNDEVLQTPIACIRAPSYSLTCREAWSEELKLGSINIRGLLWEAITALSLFIAGANIIVIMNPKALTQLKEFFKLGG
ncbi:MAG: CO dehydrogenase/acetyl-CoA synthase subunit delta [Candidatus Bathyarchaeia archaeon]